VPKSANVFVKIVRLCCKALSPYVKYNLNSLQVDGLTPVTLIVTVASHARFIEIPPLKILYNNYTITFDGYLTIRKSPTDVGDLVRLLQVACDIASAINHKVNLCCAEYTWTPMSFSFL